MGADIEYDAHPPCADGRGMLRGCVTLRKSCVASIAGADGGSRSSASRYAVPRITDAGGRGVGPKRETLQYQEHFSCQWLKMGSR